MTIGEKIKFLRQKNDVTQEKLAEYLNISYQSISKWENNYAMPDISLVVPLANFFGVSIDELFDHNAEMENAEVDEYIEQDIKLAHEGYVDERITLWREAVQKYPKNFKCLSSLACAVWNRINSGNYPNEIRENSAKETISICERILRDCTDNNIRSEAIQLLVLTYGNGTLSCGNEEKAVYYANMADSHYTSRETLMQLAYFTEEGKKKAEEYKQGNNQYYIDNLSSNICYRKYETDEEKIFALETALKLWHTLFYEGDFLFFHVRLTRIYSMLAKLYAKKQNKEKAIENLKQAYYHADKFDTLPERAKHTSVFFSLIAEGDFSTTTKNYTETEKQLTINSLKDTCYDFIREDKKFKEIFNL